MQYVESVHKEEDEFSYIYSITNELGTWVHEDHKVATNEDLMHEEQAKSNEGFTFDVGDDFFHFNDTRGFWFDFKNESVEENFLCDSNATLNSSHKSCIEDNIEGINSIEHKSDSPVLEVGLEKSSSDIDKLDSQFSIIEVLEICSSHGSMLEKNFDLFMEHNSSSTSLCDHDLKNNLLVYVEKDVQFLSRVDGIHRHMECLTQNTPSSQKEVNVTLADFQMIKNTLD